METQRDSLHNPAAATLNNDISYSYITNTDNAYHGEDNSDFRFGALSRIAELETAPRPGKTHVQDFIFNKSDIDTYINQFPSSKDYCAARGMMPLSDFTNDDTLLGTAFPHVFLLGHAYKRAPGSLSVAQRSHLLHQFHLTPSRDRRLMGFLFDVQQRSLVIKGVKAHVDNNKRSIQVFKELMHLILPELSFGKPLNSHTVIPPSKFCENTCHIFNSLPKTSLMVHWRGFASSTI